MLGLNLGRRACMVAIGGMLATLSWTMLAGTAAAQLPPLPPLPDFIKSQGKLTVGVRCDQPPYGFTDKNGQIAGVEVEIAKQIGTYAFGPGKTELTCVTAENRILQLTSKKVDLLVATLAITPERARVVDFSKYYRWSVGDVAVPKSSPITKLDDLSGRSVIVLKGALQAKWMEDNLPKAQQTRLNTVSDALQALKQGRGDAFSGDGATLIVVVANDPSLRLLGEPYMLAEGAAAVRKGETEWLAYVNAALDRIRAENYYKEWIEKTIPENIRAYYLQAFLEPKPAVAR